MARRTLLRFLTYLKPYWRRGVSAFILTNFTTLLQLPMPFLSMYILDHVLVEHDVHFLNIVIVVLLVTQIVALAAYLLQGYILEVFRQRVFFDIQKLVFEKTLELPMTYFMTNESGYVFSRIKNDTEVTKGLMADTLIVFAKDLLTLLTGLICLLIIHPRMALLFFLLMPPFVLSIANSGKLLRKLNHQLQEDNAKLSREIGEDISLISVIKLLAIQKTILRRYVKTFRQYIHSCFAVNVRSMLYGLTASFIGGLGPLVLLWFGGSEIMKGTLTLGQFFAFSTFMAYLFGPTQRLLVLNLGLQASLAAADRIFEIIDLQPEPRQHQELLPKNIKGAIEYHNVAFSYSNGHEILRDINLVFEPGSIYCLTGKSGAGKTTIINLLLGYYKPSRGAIYIDGVNLGQLDSRTVNKHIGLVPQGSSLFSTSIKNNIKFGLFDASDDDILGAARLANAHGFIMDLRHKYDSMVGERGTRLSGGERQRIAIARALVGKPRILVLDESLSEIDSESELLIIETLHRLKIDMTIVVVTHRSSTISRADKILFLSDGRIALTKEPCTQEKSCPPFDDVLVDHRRI